MYGSEFFLSASLSLLIRARQKYAQTTKLTSALCLSLAISATSARAGSEDFIFGLSAGIIGSAIVNGAKKNNANQAQPAQRKATRKRSNSSA